MSNFLTQIPVHLDRVKALLPKGSTVEKAEWNAEKQCVELHWRNFGLRTNYSWAWPWTLEQLEKREVPGGVREPEQSVAPDTKSLTPAEESPTSRQSEKVAGKVKKSSRRASPTKWADPNRCAPRHSTADTPEMERAGSGPVAGVSE